MGHPASSVTLTKFINYSHTVGCDSMHIIALPGQGKSLMANHIARRCLAETEDNMIIPGDIFCEWRHFLMYPKTVRKITLIIPEGQEIFFHNFNEEHIHDNYDIPFEMKEVDFRNFHIIDFLTDDTRSEIFVIFDNHYRGQWLWMRGNLWVTIANQLMNRTILLNTATILLFHEAGILFQQNANGKHWTAVHKFSELFVEFRKALVRVLLVSQLETEIESTIRQKCLWKCYKKGSTASKRVPRAIRKSTPFLRRDQYTLMNGGLFKQNNVITKFNELEEDWKMIPEGDPPESIIVVDEEEEDIIEQEKILEMRKNIAIEWAVNRRLKIDDSDIKETWNETASTFGITTNTLRYHYNLYINAVNT